jgi:hypothetical protein
MDTQIAAVFCLSTDVLKAMYHHEDSQIEMTDSEVMTAAIVAALYHSGVFEGAREHLQDAAKFPRC